MVDDRWCYELVCICCCNGGLPKMAEPPPPLPDGAYAVESVLQSMRVYSTAGGAQLMYFVNRYCREFT